MFRMLGCKVNQTDFWQKPQHHMWHCAWISIYHCWNDCLQADCRALIKNAHQVYTNRELGHWMSGRVPT